MADIVDDLIGLLAGPGAARRDGEAVTLAEHAAQCAWRAIRAGAPGPLVGAALLHDLGHLLPNSSAVAGGGAPDGPNGGHAAAAAAFLQDWFPPSVVRPVALHVAAKRWLCRADPAYAARLSPASTDSLARQGGPMTAEEAAAFGDDPHAAAAIRLRRWDEASKVPGLAAPPLDVYWPLLRTLMDQVDREAA